jgi:hypothetical protein
VTVAICKIEEPRKILCAIKLLTKNLEEEMKIHEQEN